MLMLFIFCCFLIAQIIKFSLMYAKNSYFVMSFRHFHVGLNLIHRILFLILMGSCNKPCLLITRSAFQMAKENNRKNTRQGSVPTRLSSSANQHFATALLPPLEKKNSWETIFSRQHLYRRPSSGATFTLRH